MRRKTSNILLTSHQNPLDIRKIAQKYTGKLRSLKFSYMVNNFFNRKKLAHNKKLYQKFGINKSIYSPIGREDVAHIDGPLPWLDRSTSLEAVEQHPTFLAFDLDRKQAIRNFIEHGYLILKNFLDKETVAEINEDIKNLIEQNQLDYNYGGKKIVESYKKSAVVNAQFFKSPQLIELLEFLLGTAIIPFHTINFIEGSEQRAHSDSIHMATAPQGYMIAAWAALEHTDQNNGPLFYYPGSHRLPFLTCLDYESGNSRYLIGESSYSKYEDYVQEIIDSNHLKKEYFHAEPGDILIWHANLLHGGDPIKEEGRTRKSMVAHYFGREVLCFHEISQRPALIDFG